MAAIHQDVLSHLTQDANVALVYWTSEPDGPVQWVSPGIVPLVGYPEEDYHNGDLHLSDIVHPEDRQHWLSMLSGAVSGETVELTSLRLRHREGNTLWVSARVHVFSTEERLHFLALLLNLSEARRLQDKLQALAREHRRQLSQRTDELERANMDLNMEANERQMAEKELQRSSSRFRAVLQNAPDIAIYGFDREGRVQYWNRTCEKWYGVPHERALGEPVSELFNLLPGDRNALDGQILTMLSTGEALVQNTGRRPKGAEEPLLVYSSMFPIREDGEVREIFCIDIDVTELRKTSEQLRQSRQFLHDILNTIADPIFVKDEDHKWILLNDAMCDFMSGRRSDLIGKSDYDFFPHEEAKVFWEKDSLVFQTGEPNVNEENFTDGDGTLHVISTKKTLLVDPDTGRKTLVGIIHDMTQSKRLERELADHRDHLQQLVDERNEEMVRSNRVLKNQYRFLQSLLDHLPHPVFYKDTTGVFLGCNKELEKMLGLPRDEIVGRTVFDLQPRELAQEFHDYDMELLERKHQKYESRVVCAEGEQRDMVISKSVFYNVDGSMGGFIGVMVDISQHKQHMQALQESYSKLEQAQEEIIRLERESSALAVAVTASHEINQPLMVLRGNMEMLRKSFEDNGCELSEPQQKFIARMEESMQSVQHILDTFKQNNKCHFEAYLDETEMAVFEDGETKQDD